MLFGRKEEINLIPEGQQELKFKKNVLIFPAILLLIFVIELIALAGGFILESQEESKNKLLEDSTAEKNQEWQKVASRSAELKSIKQNLSDYKTFSSQYPPLENYLKTLSQSIPATVKITQLSIDSAGNTDLQVEVPTPEDGYQFLEVLKANPANFSSINLVSTSKVGEGGRFGLKVTFVTKL